MSASQRHDEGGGTRGVVARGRLVFEVLAAYMPLRREMLSNDARAMVTRARRVPRRAVIIEDCAEATAESLGWIVRRVLHVLPSEKRCLIRSLVLVRLLERRGIENTFVIGVRDGASPAHAWVEHRGRPVLPTEGYEPLVSL